MGHVILAATGLKREARLIARPGVVAIAGGGDATRLEAALEARAESASALLSIGLAGALAEGLVPGDWVIGDATTPRWRDHLAMRLPRARIGSVFADGTMAFDAAVKRRLHTETDAIAVDMETHVVKRVAERRGLPLAILRVISDDVKRTLPPAARVGMRADGGIALGAVLASLILHPGQIPALVGVARDASRGMRSLFRGYDMLARVGLVPPNLGKLPFDMA